MTKNTTADYAALVRCGGCGTLWKAPPTRINPTFSNATIAEMRADPQRPVCTGVSDRPCPLCGGREINVMQSQISTRWFEGWQPSHAPRH